MDDNRRMRSGGSPLDFASITDVQVSAVHAAPDYSVSLQPRGRITRYVKQTELDSDNVFVDLAGTRRFERQDLNGSFRYNKETTLTTERTDSGNLDRNLDRTLIGFDAAWRYFFSDILSVRTSGGISDVSFEEVTGSFFTDYRQSNVGVGLEYGYSERTSLFVNTGINEFDTPDLDSTTTSYTYQFGFSHLFDESLTASLAVGQNISRRVSTILVPVLVSLAPLEIENLPRTDKERASGRLIDATVTRRFEQGELVIRWNRFFSPSSQGGRQQREEINADAEWEFSERITGEWNFSYRLQDREGQFATRVDALDVYETRARVFYALTRELSLELSYRFRHQVSPVTAVSATSNELLLGFRFSPRPVHILR